MERETSSMVVLGVVLIVLAALIAIGFSVFSNAKSTASDGQASVNQNLTAVGNSVFNDFDQKVVSGTQVLGAYQNFVGKSYAICVATNAGGITNFRNYNAVLSTADATFNVTLTYDSTKNCYTGGTFKLDATNLTQMNTNIANMSKSGTSEYVPSGAKFQSFLIKDTSGTVLGIAFSQV